MVSLNGRMAFISCCISFYNNQKGYKMNCTSTNPPCCTYRERWFIMNITLHIHDYLSRHGLSLSSQPGEFSFFIWPVHLCYLLSLNCTTLHVRRLYSHINMWLVICSKYSSQYIALKKWWSIMTWINNIMQSNACLTSITTKSSFRLHAWTNTWSSICAFCTWSNQRTGQFEYDLATRFTL